MKKTNKEYLQDAIAVAKLLRSQALSHEDRALLLNFPGGGILKECGLFTDAQNPQWLAAGRQELMQLLDSSEWTSLQNTGMQNAHYTTQPIRQAMWQAVRPYLKSGDSVLDPGCGIGGFCVDMPPDLNLHYVGVEKDILTSNIARVAFPHAHIYCKDFLDWTYPKQFRLVIGNIPFVNGVNSTRLTGKKLNVAIHAQFFLKSALHLEAGGLMVLLTSINTLDSRGADYVQFRTWLHQRCEFLGAVRLPDSGIHYGNTEVTTDLIILRKRPEPIAGAIPAWVYVGKSDLTDYNGDRIHLNTWYLEHPQYLLGEPQFSRVRGRNGNPAPSFALKRIEGVDLIEELGEKLCSILNISPKPTLVAKRRMVGESWDIKEYRHEQRSYWIKKSPGMPYAYCLNFDGFDGDYIQCPASIADDDGAIDWAVKHSKKEVEDVKLWDFQKVAGEDNFNNLHVLAIPNGCIAVWETSTRGEWFAVDKNERSIKTGADKIGNWTFRGNDPYEIAIKAYNWLLSKTHGDKFTIHHPWVGRHSSGVTLDDQEINGVIASVEAAGEVIRFVSIRESESEIPRACAKWVFSDEQIQQKETTTMATVIPADKFQSDSVFAFILRENPKQKGIEIHLPPESEAKTEQEVGFIARILAAGFQQAKANPKLYYISNYSDDLIAKCRSWVKACSKFGAYEISPDEPVEQTKSRRRYPAKSSTAAPAVPTPAPATPNKLAADVASLVVEQMGNLTEQIADTIIDRLKLEHAASKEVGELKAQVEQLQTEKDEAQAKVTELEKQLKEYADKLTSLQSNTQEIITGRDKQIADLQTKINELQKHAADVEAQVEDVGAIIAERDRYRDTLSQYGLVDNANINSEVPVFDDDSVPDTFPNFEESESSVPDFGDETTVEQAVEQATDTPDEAGFDLDSLGNE